MATGQINSQSQCSLWLEESSREKLNSIRALGNSLRKAWDLAFYLHKLRAQRTDPDLPGETPPSPEMMSLWTPLLAPQEGADCHVPLRHYLMQHSGVSPSVQLPGPAPSLAPRRLWVLTSPSLQAAKLVCLPPKAFLISPGKPVLHPFLHPLPKLPLCR